ncbi:hypothetical protein HOG98_00390 [bacterium]|jgi:hypothetical protein|nr:hypothetical protein [bacterium]
MPDTFFVDIVGLQKKLEEPLLKKANMSVDSEKVVLDSNTMVDTFRSILGTDAHAAYVLPVSKKESSHLYCLIIKKDGFEHRVKKDGVLKKISYSFSTKKIIGLPKSSQLSVNEYIKKLLKSYRDRLSSGEAKMVYDKKEDIC